MMMDFYQMFVIALAVEALWETVKMLWQEGKLCIDRLGAVVFGIVLCVMARIDFFDIVAVPLCYPVVGNILSGILASRGANFVHDLYTSVEKLAGNE